MLFLKRLALARGVKIIDKIFISELLKNNETVNGAAGFGIITGDYNVFSAKATIIANGGCRYKRTKMFNMCNGEGVAMAFRAGAELMNAEFSNTYGYTLRDYEVTTRDPIYYFFVNSKGERIIEKHYPELAEAIRNGRELQDFSKITDAMSKEVFEGNGPIYIDFKNASPEEKEFAYGKILNTAKLDRPIFHSPWKVVREKGKGDFENDKLEFMPMFVGGQGPIKVDLNCRTNLPGLWAVGDASALGCGWSGARSPGTRPALGVPFAIVSGNFGGIDAGKQSLATFDGILNINNSDLSEVREMIYAPLKRATGKEPFEVSYALHEVVVPVKNNFYRNQKDLEKCLEKIRILKEEISEIKADSPHDLMKAHEVASMVISAEVSFASANFRNETRGTHKRTDYPNKNDQAWLSWVIARNEGDKVKLIKQRVPIKDYKYRPNENNDNKIISQ
jgi:succinate dehydrogenase/fumarate reductase flavoprotein subunit